MKPQTAPRVLRPAYLVFYGAHIHDDQRWQTGDWPNARTEPTHNRHDWRHIMITAAPTRPDERQATEPELDLRKHHHPLDQFIPDPSGLMPLSDEPGFAAILESVVADEAPRLFAIVQEYGERVDGRIAAWGMAFDDYAEVVSVSRGVRASLRTPEDALRLFNCGSHIRARLVWFNPDAATPSEDETA